VGSRYVPNALSQNVVYLRGDQWQGGACARVASGVERCRGEGVALAEVAIEVQVVIRVMCRAVEEAAEIADKVAIMDAESRGGGGGRGWGRSVERRGWRGNGRNQCLTVQQLTKTKRER
jgi:hypothetical protein